MRGATTRAVSLRRRSRNFNPRSSCEERHNMSGVRFSSKTFQSTLLMRGATRASLHLFQRIPISIHAPHARSDDIRIIDADFIDDFNPRSSCEERPDHCKSITVTIIFQSTLLMRGATFSSAASSTFPGVFQSTLLMRGATNSSSVSELAKTISIHAPHARSDERQAVIDPHVDEFQSTLLMRGATRAGRQSGRRWSISIHAPHARSD